MVGALALFAAGLCPGPALALRVPPTGVPRLVNADVPLLPDGVLLFEQDTGSEPFGATAVEIHTESGELVAGAIERPTTLAGEPIGVSWPGVWIWRPSTPFADARYTGIARNTFTGEMSELAFEVAQDAPRELVLADVIELTLEAYEVDRAPPSLCCTRDDAVPPNCFSPVFLRGPRVHLVVDTLDPHPALRQLLFYPRTDDPSADRISFAFADRRGPQAYVQWREPQAEHCVRVEVFDARSRALDSPVERCFPNDPALFAGEIEKPVSALAGSITALGCHRPPAGFEPQWCSANQGHCFQRESLGCQHFEELCPEYPREPERPVFTTDAGAPAPPPEPTASMPEPEPERSSTARAGGCAVQPGTTSPRALLAALLALYASSISLRGPRSRTRRTTSGRA